MNNRKTSIGEKIADYTWESIVDNSYSFEHCNAHDIAIELNIDRSNVSRILNQLFNEYKLIKITGRPTTYLSRDVIVQEFRYAKAPHILDSKDDLKEQLIHNAPITQKVTEKFQITGSNSGESLCELIDQILPRFLFPQSSPLLIVLHGEAGSGKKYFCKQMLQYAIQKKAFPRHSTALSVIYNPDATDTAYILNQIQLEHTALIMIEFFHPVSEKMAYCIQADIRNLYDNHDKHQPLLVFVLEGNINEASKFCTLTPCIAYFPSFSQRTLSERIKLLLSLMQDASDRNQIHLRFNRDILTMLLLSHYKYNVYQLQNEITYAVSSSLYFSRDNSATLLPHFLSGEIRKSQSENSNYIQEITGFVESTLPDFIDLYPDTPCALSDLLSPESNVNLRLPKVQKSFHENVLDDVLRTDVLLSERPDNESLHNVLRSCFSQTRIENDIPLLNHLYAIIQKMLDGTFVMAYIEESELPEFSKTTVKLSTGIFEKLLIAKQTSLSKPNRDYIRLFIESSLAALSESSLSYVIVTHTRQIAQNYASYMNYITASRTYYAIDFPLEDQAHYSRFLKRVQSLLKTLDQSREIILISDKAPLVNLPTLLVGKLRHAVLSLSPLTLPILMKTAKMMKEEDLHGMTTVRNVIYAKKEIMQVYNRKTNSFPSEYIAQNISQYFELYFEGTNTSLANNVFYNITKNVFQHFNCDLTNGLILEVLLHCNFILSRSTARQEIMLDSPDTFIAEYLPLYQYVKKQFADARELLNYNIKENELIVLCELFINHMDPV